MKYSDKTNKDILTEVKKMEMDHQNLKTKLLSLLEQIEEVEKEYSIAIEELKKRGIK